MAGEKEVHPVTRLCFSGYDRNGVAHIVTVGSFIQECLNIRFRYFASGRAEQQAFKCLRIPVGKLSRGIYRFILADADDNRIDIPA